MKRIPKEVYVKLTIPQRVVACIEAAARGDDAEKAALIDTCPKRNYLQTDVAFSETMECLMGLAMAVECDLRELALRYFLLLQTDVEAAAEALQSLANVRYAWELTLDGMGIDPSSMKAAGPPGSAVLKHLENMFPSPDEQAAEAHAADCLASLRAAMQ